MAFEDTFINFLNSIQKICERKLEIEGQDELLQLLKEVVGTLSGPKVNQELSQAISAEEKKDVRNKVSAYFLEKEMEYFVNSVQRLGEDPPVEKLNPKMEQAKTIKDSISIWLPPWSWLKKLLDILNELLDLIKALP